MSVPDYKKVMVEIKKWDSESKTTERTRHRELSEASAAIAKAADAIKSDVALWSLGYQHLYTINRGWYKVADKLIAKQAELAAAEKAKDKGKSATLTKEIEKLHKDALKLETGFGKAHSELVKLDKKFSAIIRAAKALPA